VNVLEHGRVNGLASRFDVGHLSADHSPHRAGRRGDFTHQSSAALRAKFGARQHFKGAREQPIARENGHGFAEYFVVCGASAAQVVVVESGKIVVDQRISMDEFESAGHGEHAAWRVGEYARALQAENRPDALASRENTVAHGTMNNRGRLRFRGQERVQGRIDLSAVRFNELAAWLGGHRLPGGRRLRHDGESSSVPFGRKGSAASLPSADLSRISTRPSASWSCFWHC